MSTFSRRSPAHVGSPVRLSLLVAAALAFAGPLYADDQAAVPVVTLQQCVDQAMTTGPDFLASGIDLGIAQASYQYAQAPQRLGLSASATGAQKSPFSDVGTSPLPASTGTASVAGGLMLTGPSGLSAGATVTQSVAEDPSLAQSTQVGVNTGITLWDGYPGGQAKASAEQAGITLDNARLSDDAARKNAAYVVKQAYYSLLAQQRQVGVLQDSLAKRQAETRNTQALFEAQSASELDVKQSQVNEEQARLDLLKAKDTLRTLREQLSTLVGWASDKQYTVAEVADLQVPSIQEADAVNTALAQRDDVLQLAQSKQAAEITLDLRKAEQSPSVKASAGLSWTHGWSDGADALTLSAGLTVQGQIIDTGAVSAQVQQAQLQLQRLDLQMAQKVAQVTTAVEAALANVRDLVSRVDLARANVDLAQNEYDLKKIQLDRGVSSNLDVLSASVNLTTARMNLEKARSDAQLGVLALQNALGE